MIENETVGKIESLTKSVMDYTDTRIELFRLTLVSKSSVVLASVLSIFIISVFIFAALGLLSVGVAIWIGSKIGGIHNGFFIVGGVYIIVGVIIYLLKGSVIQDKISKVVIKKALK